METTVAALPEPGSHDRIASPVHTVIVLVVLAAWAVWGKFQSDQLRAMANPNRLVLYTSTFVFEWILFAVVILGVRKHGSPLSSVLGERWRSTRQILIDIGIAAAFWVCSGGFTVSTEQIAARRWDGQKHAIHASARRIANWHVDCALDYSRNLRRNDFSRILSEAVHFIYEECSRRHRFFGRGIRRRSRLPGIANGGADRSVWRDVWDSGALAKNCSSGNDRPCLAGFIGRNRRGPD